MHSQTPSMTRSLMSGRRWAKPLLRWTASLAPEPKPASPPHSMGKIRILKPCLPQSGQGLTAGHGLEVAQGGKVHEGEPLATPTEVKVPQVQGQTWGQLLSLSRMLGTALMRTLSETVAVRTLSGGSPCRTVCSPSKASTGDGQLGHLLAWSGTHSSTTL